MASQVASCDHLGLVQDVLRLLLILVWDAESLFAYVNILRWVTVNDPRPQPRERLVATPTLSHFCEFLGRLLTPVQVLDGTGQKAWLHDGGN